MAQARWSSVSEQGRTIIAMMDIDFGIYNGTKEEVGILEKVGA
jgi:hypothetical protein